MRAVPSQIRFAWAAVLVVLLALRCLAPAGFMPAFNGGAVMIVPCPDADGTAMPAMHDHHNGVDHSIAHQPCPYAAASSLGATGPEWPPLLIALIFSAVVLVLGRTFASIERNALRERPPAIGPPIPA